MGDLLTEVGRKVSGKNEGNIRAAVTALVAILDQLTDPEQNADATGEQNGDASTVHVGTESGRKYAIARRNGAFMIREDVSSDTVVPPPPTIDDVRKSLQAIIDALPENVKKDMEGDGADDEDDGKPIIRTSVGNNALNPSEAARTFSDDARKDFAKKGIALPDGSYPIPDKDALRRAKMSYGRNPSDTVKAHINKRARALGEPEMGDDKAKESGIACGDCGEGVGKWDSFCGNCGSSLGSGDGGGEGSHCSSCGALLGGNKFCKGCGAEAPMPAAPAKEAAAKADADDENANSTVHHEAFTKMSDEEQIAHLKGSHGMGISRGTMTRPGRVTTHSEAHDSSDSGGTTTTMPPDESTESATLFFGDLVPLVEKATDRNGEIDVKVIQPGWGASGYYSPAVLESDGPTAFKKGTHMFWDHPTKSEESERPERSLNGLAAVLQEDARYSKDHPSGPGLYARAKVFENFRPAVNELAPHIGVSIRALGKSKMGEAEGKRGPIIEKLAQGQSVDFVTVAGAGGQVLHQFAEAGRVITTNTANANVGDSAVADQQLKEAQAKLDEATKELARYREAAVLREAGDSVRALINEHGGNLPDITRDRLHREIVARPPLTEDGALDSKALTKNVREAIAAETDYLAKVVGTGRIRGFGAGTGGDDGKKYGDDLAAEFQRLGLSESASKIAAAGR